MNELLEYKGKFMKIYHEFEAYFKVAAKFIFALLTLNSISSGLGYFEVLNLISIRLFIAVVCAFIPVPMVVFVMVAVILLHLFKLSVIFAALALVVFLMMYLLYLKFAPSQGMYMLAVVALAPFHLDVAIPLIAGMFFTPVAIIPISIGIFTVKFLSAISGAAVALGTSTEIDAIVASIQSVADKLMGDKEMVLYIIAFAAVTVLVYIVKKLPFDYSWYAAIAAGAILNIVMLVAGGSVLGVEISIGGVLIGTVAAALVSALLQFLECTVDYKHKEFLEFEDDDYYYYVKAIPKLGSIPYEAPAKKERKSSADKKSEGDSVSQTETQWISELSETMAKEPSGDTVVPNKKPAGKAKAPVNTPLQDDFGSFDSFDFDDFDDSDSKF